MDEFGENPMTYNGNHVFHYTSLESAVKIIESGRLLFSDFSNMNDIAEVKRDLYCNCDKTIIYSLLAEYKSISLTKDSNPTERGFAIDTLWGYYAEKGNGVCLVFNKKVLFETYYHGYACAGVPESLEIDYPDSFTNRLEFDSCSMDELRTEIRQHLKDIFYTKDYCWSHEKEIRLLTIKGSSLPIDKSLIGVILCLPKEKYIEDTIQYTTLHSLQAEKKFHIFRYTTINGEKVLLCGDDTLWPIIGVDLFLRK